MSGKKKIHYTLKGFVLGNYWGGGVGAYASITLENDNLNKLKEQAEEKLKSGALDGGMGFESLKGAYMALEIETSIMIDYELYINKKFDTLLFGEMNDEELEFLEDVYFSN